MDASTDKKGRREDARLVSGRGKYTSDWDIDGQAYGSFLRSDHTHAEIVSIDTSEALTVPGVLAVLTGADVVKAGFKTPPAIMFMKGKGGSSFKLPHRHALAHERVRFVGEPVALVVAETEAIARDGGDPAFRLRIDPSRKLSRHHDGGDRERDHRSCGRDRAWVATRIVLTVSPQSRWAKRCHKKQHMNPCTITFFLLTCTRPRERLPA